MLDEGRPADSLLHAELAALHLSGKINLTFASQQRDCTHFAQIYANGVVGIDRLFDLLCGVEIFFLYILWMEEISILVERQREPVWRVGKKLILELIH
jgi:hypothetical protein